MRPKVTRDQICNFLQRYGTTNATKKIIRPKVHFGLFLKSNVLETLNIKGKCDCEQYNEGGGLLEY